MWKGTGNRDRGKKNGFQVIVFFIALYLFYCLLFIMLKTDGPSCRETGWLFFVFAFVETKAHEEAALSAAEESAGHEEGRGDILGG